MIGPVRASSLFGSSKLLCCYSVALFPSNLQHILSELLKVRHKDDAVLVVYGFNTCGWESKQRLAVKKPGDWLAKDNKTPQASWQTFFEQEQAFWICCFHKICIALFFKKHIKMFYRKGVIDMHQNNAKVPCSVICLLFVCHFTE